MVYFQSFQAPEDEPFMLQTSNKNRYANVPKAVDFTIDQDWESYSPKEHDR